MKQYFTLLSIAISCIFLLGSFANPNTPAPPQNNKNENNLTCELPAPANFMVLGFNTNSIKVRWNKVPNAVAYQLVVTNTSNTATNPLFITVPAPTTNTITHNILGLTAGQTYNIQVMAICGNGDVSSMFALLTAHTIIIEDILVDLAPPPGEQSLCSPCSGTEVLKDAAGKYKYLYDMKIMNNIQECYCVEIYNAAGAKVATVKFFKRDYKICNPKQTNCPIVKNMNIIMNAATGEKYLRTTSPTMNILFRTTDGFTISGLPAGHTAKIFRSIECYPSLCLSNATTGSATNLNVITPETMDLTHHTLDVFPNPFQDDIQISYNLANECVVNIQIFDMMGRQMNVIQPPILQDTGNHQMDINTPFASGLYYIVLKAGDETLIQKIVKMD